MRRIVACSLVSVLALAGCSRRSALPPEEVLHRSAQVSQLLQSAQFESDGTFAWDALEGSFDIDGVLQSGGEEVAFTLDLSVTSPGQGGGVLSAELDVIRAAGGQIFLRVRALSGDAVPSVPGADAAGVLLDRWWVAPGDASTRAAGGPTPDPTLLQAQAATVSITGDKGLTTVRGRRAYHYDVTVDPGKLAAHLRDRREGWEDGEGPLPLEELSASGTLWIDAGTFALLRASWMIQPLTLQSGRTVSLSFTVDFSRFDSAPEIRVPQQSEPLSSLLLSEPFPPGKAQPSLSPDMELLRELLEGSGENPYTGP